MNRLFLSTILIAAVSLAATLCALAGDVKVHPFLSAIRDKAFVRLTTGKEEVFINEKVSLSIKLFINGAPPKEKILKSLEEAIRYL